MANEKRLIDANALKKCTCEWCNTHYSDEPCEPSECIEMLRIDSQPTVDAVEVVHAHWEDGCGVDCYGNIAYKSIDCSHCNEIFKIKSRTGEYWKERFKVCPFCGAKMDGDGKCE